MQTASFVGPALFCAGLAAATGMDALVKWLTAGRSMGELLLWRGFGALPLLMLFAAVGSGGIASLRPRSWRFVLGRGVVIALGTLLFFWSLKGLSLTAAYVAAFTAPLMLTALAAATRVEHVGWPAWLGVLAGFAGVLVAALPGGIALVDAASLPGLAALVATFLYALGLFLVRHGGGAGETAGSLVLGNLLATGVLGAALLGATRLGTGAGSVPAYTATDLVCLVGIAGLAGVSQILVTLAFAAAPASRLAPFEYVTLPLGAALGYAGWGDVPGPATVLGASIVVASVVWVARRAGEEATRQRELG